VECGEVIKGWDQGIVQMSKGERSKMTIPPSLAYGTKGFPGLIPPNTPIVFEVTLLDVA
jgi:peptidylprolyl isomerase